MSAADLKLGFPRSPATRATDRRRPVVASSGSKPDRVRPVPAAADAVLRAAQAVTPAATRARFAGAILPAVMAAAAYMSSIGGGYTFDDRWVILQNPLVQQAGLWEIFTGVYTPGPVYRPLTLLTFAVHERLGWNPLADHIGNVALHVLVTLLVYALAGRITRSEIARVFGAMLFALHPIHTEAVANLVGRAELLAAVCALTSLVAFARFVERRDHAALWLFTALATFAIGPFAKESSLSILPVIVLLQRHLAPATPWRRHATVAMAFLAAALPYLFARIAFTGALTYPTHFAMADNPLAHVPAAQRIATALVVLVEYLGLLLAPITLSADYSYNQIPIVTSFGDLRLWLAIAVLLGITSVVWRVRQRSPAMILCAAFVVCTLSLTSNLAFPIGTIKGERLLYLPSVGWCIAIGLVAAWALRRHFAATSLAVSLVFVLYGARTWARGYDWRDDASLYEATAQSAVNSAKAQYNYGTILLENGAVDDAVVQFRRALQIDPQSGQAAFGIGKAYELKGVPAGALHWYGKTTELNWDTPHAHLQIGLIRKQLGEHAAAEAAFRTGLRQNPADPFLLLNLGAVRIAQGDSWEARALVRTYDNLGWTHPRYRLDYAAARHALMNELRR
jgi:tetratricopeptide (TPR) repeat protein